MTGLPLLRAYRADSVFAYCGGQRVGVGRFLRDVAQLAALLPARRHVFNLCGDRYRFTVGFCAALVRRQINLLPPNHTADLIGRLTRRYADVYCLTDVADDYRGLETVRYPALTSADAAPPEIPSIPAAHIAALVFTSGSTGEPVPNEKSWGVLVRGAAAELERLDRYLTPGMTVLGTVPPQHMYGLESTVLMAIQGGLALHAGRPLYPADVLAELVALPRPRCLVTTPVHLRAVVSETAGLPPVDLILCATAPLSPQLAATAEARLGAPLYEIYGCTEAGQVATRRTTATAEWQTLPGVRVRQAGSQSWVSGGHVEREIQLQDIIEAHGAETFLLHGRSADLVNIAGKRTSLASLNYHLNSIAGVRDGAFFVPEQTDDAVTRLTAFVVAPGLTREALLDALRERIDAAFLPRPLYMVDALPRNATGKLPREAFERFSAERVAKAG